MADTRSTAPRLSRGKESGRMMRAWVAGSTPYKGERDNETFDFDGYAGVVRGIGADSVDRECSARAGFGLEAGEQDGGEEAQPEEQEVGKGHTGRLDSPGSGSEDSEEVTVGPWIEATPSLHSRRCTQMNAD